MPFEMAATPVYYGHTETDGDRKVVKGPVESVSRNDGTSGWMPVEPAGVASLDTCFGSDTYWKDEARFSFITPGTWFYGVINDGMAGEQWMWGGWEDSTANDPRICHCFS
jgi:hypothetical protein